MTAAEAASASGPEEEVQPQTRSWFALGLLSLVSFFAYMDRTAIAMLMVPIKAELGLSDAQLGLLTGFAFAAFYSILGIPLARLADRHSRVKLLSVCLALWSLMTLLSGYGRNFLQLFILRAGVGVGEAGCVPASHSLISDLFPAKRRALAITIFQAGGAAGLSLGLFVVGLLADNYGWRVTLQVIGAAGVPLALVVLLTLREPARPADTATAGEPALTAIGSLMRRPALLHLVLAYALGSVSTYGITQWLPTFLVRSFGMSLTEVGAWSGLASGFGSIGGLLCGGALATWLFARDRRWELWLPALTYAISVPLLIAICLSPTAFHALVFKAVGYFFSAIGGGVALAAVQSFAEPRRRATAVSLMILFSSLLGLGLGPYLVGVLSDLFEPAYGKESLRYALLCVCVLVVMSVVHFMLAARSSERDRVG